jgi:molecular chaperone IbpA
MNRTLLSSLFNVNEKDLDKFFIGFDKQVAQFKDMHDQMAKNIPNYPPYNIKKIDDNHYTIELAVAGFAQQDIDIEIEGGKLVIKGNVKATDDDENFIFKGIANRAFTRWFALEDNVEVKDAEIFNGMLKIALERLVPEQAKAKKVTIKSKGEKQLLNEEK